MKDGKALNNFILVLLIIAIIVMSHWILSDSIGSTTEIWYRYLILVIIVFSIFFFFKRIFFDDVHKFTKAVKYKKLDTNQYHSVEMELIKEIFNRYSKDIESAKEELKHLSYEDKLTGAFNKNFFTVILNEYVNNFNRYDTKYSLMIFDIDDFEKLIDKYGSDDVDRVMVDVVHLIEHTIRKTDILCRIDDNEFALLMINTGLVNSYEHVALKLNDLIAEHTFTKGIRITLSAGVTAVKTGDVHSTILARAKEYVRYSKTNGGNLCTYDVSYKNFPKRGNNHNHR
jgi:diguanylate cyclase (GGDEF)-like protein